MILLKTATILVGLLTLVSSCNSLSRGDAESKINTFFKEQKNSFLSSSTVVYAVVRGEGERYNSEFKELEPYIDAGLLKLNKKDVRPDTQPVYWYIYELTEKGKPYLIKQEWSEGDYPVYYVKTYDLKVDEIIRLKMASDNKEAVVDFTLEKENITPFGEVVTNKTSIQILQAYMNLYDDGWRIENIKYLN